jgi:hypothetical protein
MNVEIGTEAPIFLFWEYLFQIFDILSLQCVTCRDPKGSGKYAAAHPTRHLVLRVPAPFKSRSLAAPFCERANAPFYRFPNFKYNIL